MDYTFATLDESLIGVALVESSSQRKVLDKMKKNKRRTAEDSGWLISEGRCVQPQTFPVFAPRLHASAHLRTFASVLGDSCAAHSCDGSDRRPGSCFDHPATGARSRPPFRPYGPT